MVHTDLRHLSVKKLLGLLTWKFNLLMAKCCHF